MGYYMQLGNSLNLCVCLYYGSRYSPFLKYYTKGTILPEKLYKITLTEQHRDMYINLCLICVMFKEDMCDV